MNIDFTSQPGFGGWISGSIGALIGGAFMLQFAWKKNKLIKNKAFLFFIFGISLILFFGISCVYFSSLSTTVKAIGWIMYVFFLATLWIVGFRFKKQFIKKNAAEQGAAANP